MNVTAAVVREKEGPFGIEEVELEEPRADEILVRIAGVCNTGLICRDQWYPLPVVFEHEGAGVVERLGQGVSKVQPGARVGLGYHSCGRCRNCLIAKPTYCPDFYNHNFAGPRPGGTNAYHKGGDESTATTPSLPTPSRTGAGGALNYFDEVNEAGEESESGGS